MNKWGWVVVIALALTALAWVAPGFTGSLAGELGKETLRLIGVLLWPLALIGYALVALQWLTTPADIRRELWRLKQF